MCLSSGRPFSHTLPLMLLLFSLYPGRPLAGGGDFPSVDCVITPSRMVDVSSAVPGLISEVKVERSDRVEQGQVVAQLQAGVERAMVAYAREKASLTSEIRLGKVNQTFDGRRLKRLDSLYTKKVASYQEKDDAQRRLALSKWELLKAKETNRLRQLELLKAEELLKEKTVRSPLSGFVVQRFKNPGEYVEDQPILRIAQLDPLHVEAIVPMELFGRIRPGMEAEVFPEFYDAEPRRARVALIDRLGDAASGTFGIRLVLPNPELKLPAGLKCRLRFLSGQEQRPFSADQPVISGRINGKGMIRSGH